MTGKKSNLGNPPDGHSTITPYLVAHRPHDLINFLAEAFDAVEKARYTASDGRLEYAEMEIGDSKIMISEATASNPATPSNINVYVGDVDAVFSRALKAGGTSESDPQDQPHGERTGVVKDSTGNKWLISTQIEKLTVDEIKERVKKAETD